VVDLENLGELGHTVRRLLCPGRIAVAHEDEGEQRKLDRRGIDARAVSLDDVALLELADPFEDGRRGKVHLSGDLGIRDSSVGLEHLQYLEINSVDHSEIVHKLG
jgi:hypothetical protein